ncbi:hypothetical protein MKEN_00355800 [Mycena kentingensis (nom. inval.)]|nr:hypothetical protein MKEN_00355800 [Mycena kentingensis (nom. inval.)]
MRRRRSQRLVPFCLLDTDYKARAHIIKASQRRHKTIANRLDRYNAAALALSPPRRTFTKEDLTNLTFVADFDLLREGHVNIREQPWAQPGGPGRQAMDLNAKLLRAAEEIIRLDIEIRRLWTWMQDESEFLKKSEKHLREVDNNPSLAYQVRLLRLERERFDHGHRRRLLDLTKIPGVSPGLLTPGRSVDESRHQEPVSRSAGQAPAPTIPSEGEDEDEQEWHDVVVEENAATEAEEEAPEDNEEVGELIEAVIAVGG